MNRDPDSQTMVGTDFPGWDDSIPPPRGGGRGGGRRWAFDPGLRGRWSQEISLRLKKRDLGVLVGRKQRGGEETHLEVGGGVSLRLHHSWGVVRA